MKARSTTNHTRTKWPLLAADPQPPELTAAISKDRKQVVSAAHRRASAYSLAELLGRAVVVRVHVVHDQLGASIKDFASEPRELVAIFRVSGSVSRYDDRARK